MPSIPYVIDNETHRMADVLNAILAEHAGRALDSRRVLDPHPVRDHAEMHVQYHSAHIGIGELP